MQPTRQQHQQQIPAWSLLLMEPGSPVSRFRGDGLARRFYLVVSFLVVRPYVEGALHQQLPQISQVSLEPDPQTPPSSACPHLNLHLCVFADTEKW